MNLPFRILAAALFCSAPWIAAAGEAEVTTSAREPAEEAVEDVMQLPLDGSSIESFEAGVERIRTGATAGDFMKFSSAIEYLLFYDLSVRKNRELLYRKLDGKSAAEISAMVPR